MYIEGLFRVHVSKLGIVIVLDFDSQDRSIFRVTYI